jgi:hypothetical protein
MMKNRQFPILLGSWTHTLCVKTHEEEKKVERQFFGGSTMFGGYPSYGMGYGGYPYHHQYGYGGYPFHHHGFGGYPYHHQYGYRDEFEPMYDLGEVYN